MNDAIFVDIFQSIYDLSEEIAYIVENDLILNSLAHETENVPGKLEIRYQTRIADYGLPQEEEKPAQVTLNDGTSLSADLIVSISLISVYAYNFSPFN